MSEADPQNRPFQARIADWMHECFGPVVAGDTCERNRRWGRVNGRGRNLLGRMLMRVRAGLGGSAYDDGELQALIERGEALLEASCAQ